MQFSLLAVLASLQRMVIEETDHTVRSVNATIRVEGVSVKCQIQEDMQWDRIELPSTADFHVHLRDGKMMETADHHRGTGAIISGTSPASRTQRDVLDESLSTFQHHP